MTHLTADQLYAIVFDQAAPDTAIADHLALCPACRTELDQLRQMAGDLAVARLSEPSPAALQRYAALFAQVQQRGSRLGEFWQTLRATLAWDSRQQPATQGVRSGAAAGYRLLYTTPRAEVELMVEPGQHSGVLEGDIIELSAGEGATPALVQLLDDTKVATHETEAGADGRFRLENVQPGIYRLLITPVTGAAVEIDPLEIG